MKIAIIQPRSSYYVAGSEKVSFKHCEYLAELGHNIILYTTSRSASSQSFIYKEFLKRNLAGVMIKEFNIPLLINVHSYDHTLWLKESQLFSKAIQSDILKESPDIIFSYYLPDNIINHGSSCSIVYLSGYTNDIIPAYKKMIRSCDATISISSIVKEKWEPYIKNIRHNYILLPGTDTAPIGHNILINKNLKILFIGRLIERKGSLTLVDASLKLIREGFNIHVYIVGDGPLMAVINEQLRAGGFINYFTLTGIQENIYDYIYSSDICIFPSYEGDGLMGVVTEAMAVGKPIITTYKSGSEDVIENNKTGVLIPPRNTDALVEAVKRLISDAQDRTQIGVAARNFIEQNLTWKIHTEKLVSIFEDCMRKKTTQ